MQISFVIPALNEAAGILPVLKVLQPLRNSLPSEIILVDGGSTDNTLALAKPLCDKIISTMPGRALQMNAGAQLANGTWLIFLHADSQLPPDFELIWSQVISRSERVWGRFDLQLSGQAKLLRLIERMINLRSRITGIATGDQAIFVRRDLFEQLDGYANIPLMEDVDLSRRLKRRCRPLCIPSKLTTSSRRWESQGIVKTVVLMWKLRLLYFVGVSPLRLNNYYYGRKEE